MSLLILQYTYKVVSKTIDTPTRPTLTCEPILTSAFRQARIESVIILVGTFLLF